MKALQSTFIWCSVFSAVACVWALRHCCQKQYAVRRRLFWAQLVALVTADLLSTAALITCQLLANFPQQDERYKSYKNAVTCGCVLWSLLIEVQIALAFAASCHKIVRWTKVLRLSVLFSFLYATLVAVALGACAESQMAARSATWAAHVVLCNLFACVFYLWAFVGTLSLPSLIRRKAVLRGATYAIGTFLVYLPNAVLDTITVIGGVDVDRAPMTGTSPKGGWEIAGIVCQLLYTLNGAINIGTYAFWIPRKADPSDQQDLTLSALEEMALHNYFDLTSTDLSSFISRTSTAEAIAVAREVRSSMAQSETESGTAKGPLDDYDRSSTPSLGPGIVDFMRV